jgi:hypothetical protein
MTLDMNLFEIIVSVAVLVIVVGIWIYNRISGKERAIHLDVTLVVVIVTIALASIFGATSSDIIKNNPLLFVVAIISLVTAIGSFWDTYITFKFRKDLEDVTARLRAQVAGLGNIMFFPTKEETFKNLTSLSIQAHEKLMATRFSPADISIETEYWNAIRQCAFDPKVLYVRIHSLAHPTTSTVDGLCKLISELRGSRQFRLGITFFNNEFEMIIADDKECIFCFHDLEMTIKNGFRVDTTLPSNAAVVANFGETFRHILDKCYLIVDFEKFIQTDADVKALQEFLRQTHKDYCEGKLPKPIHANQMETFLRNTVFKSLNQ